MTMIKRRTTERRRPDTESPSVVLESLARNQQAHDRLNRVLDGMVQDVRKRLSKPPCDGNS